MTPEANISALCHEFTNANGSSSGERRWPGATRPHRAKPSHLHRGASIFPGHLPFSRSAGPSSLRGRSPFKAAYQASELGMASADVLLHLSNPCIQLSGRSGGVVCFRFAVSTSLPLVVAPDFPQFSGITSYIFPNPVLRRARLPRVSSVPQKRCDRSYHASGAI
jgi:hypothetical protein